MTVDSATSLPAVAAAFETNPNIIVYRTHKGQYSALDGLHELDYAVDAIIIDLILPRGDGISLTEEIRRNEALRKKQPPIPIWWVTDVEFDPEDPLHPFAKLYKANHVSGLFFKPVDPVKIIWSVRDAVLASS